ncbi:MAG TPA: DUF4350 domain-containing protein, partial [Sphingopyxis sp.]|nr:DUF4350 domain-containing protein [Sphingopyxis sp.]
MSADTASANPFSPRLIAGIVAMGVVAFIALWVLIAFGPQLSDGSGDTSGRNTGHALSRAAPGYAGIVDLAERAGAHVEILRKNEIPYYDDYSQLVVLTPTHRTRQAEIAELLSKAGGSPVLLVLPKWHTATLPGQEVKPGWAGFGAPASAPERLLPEDRFGKISIQIEDAQAGRTSAWLAGRSVPLALPEDVQTIAGDGLDILAEGPGGRAILARAGDGDVYILADPDLINNFAFADRDRARAAAALLDALAEDADAQGLAFDVTLNGLGGGRSLLRFAFVPPFIGITLCLIAAFLFALWQAWARFGPALKPARAIPVSKAALIANSADLIKQAG